MARLTAARRAALPKGSFAIPQKRAYPIMNESHARNALARASANASPAEQAAIRRKVKKRYPSIQVGGTGPGMSGQ